MPDAMRNSATWKGLLPLAAGTGREFEVKRERIIKKWEQAHFAQPQLDWESFNPCGLLKRLIAAGGKQTTALAS